MIKRKKVHAINFTAIFLFKTYYNNQVFNLSFLNKKDMTLLYELVKTDFKLRYKGSAIGYLWSIFKPLILFAMMYLVFVRFLKFGQGIPYMALSLLIGTVSWTFFSEATISAMLSIVNRGDLIRKLNFPKIIIPISATIGAFINFMINLVIVLLIGMFTGATLHWTIVLLPLYIIELYALSLGVGLILSTFYVKFRDIAQVWDLTIQAGFYFTPIFYPIQMVMSMSALGAKIMMLNPIAEIIQNMRRILAWHETPTIAQIVNHKWVTIIPVLIVVFILAIGLYVFNKNAAKFAEVV
jgi:ABC-2 type transport system permease protein